MTEPIDPRDLLMFDTMQKLEDEAARLLFDRVRAEANQIGMNVLNDDEKAILYKYKEKKEVLARNRSDEATRQLGLLEVVQSAIHRSGETRPRPAADPPRSYPIRTICPKFSPGSDPFGALDTWLAGVNNFIRLQRVDNASDQKSVLFSSIDLNAQFRLGDRLLPDSAYVESLTYPQHVEEVRLTFSPPEESILWKSDYKFYKQLCGTTITDYLQRKGQLYKLGYRQTLDCEHLIEEAIAHVYHHNVRKEIIRLAPKTFKALISASQFAVGLIRQMESLANPNAVGLASVTHTAPALASTSSRPATSLGEMALGVEQENYEGFEEPLTVSPLEFCLFNESDEETLFWSNQPKAGEGDYDNDVVGEMGGPQDSPASPEGPCWFCSKLGHVKRTCPSRLKSVHARSGASRPSRGFRGGRSATRVGEVRRGSSRRGRFSPRNTSSSSSSAPAEEEGEKSPEDEYDENVDHEEVGGLYDAHHDQSDF